MRYLIFSDVHANWWGMHHVLRFADENSIDQLIFLGDIIGYNGYPNECVEALQKNNVIAIQGNHEGLLLKHLPQSTCNSERAQYTLKVTRTVLTHTNYEYLKSLPTQLVVNSSFIIIHASFRNLYETINTPEKAYFNLKHLTQQGYHIAFFGHTHRAGVYTFQENSQQVTYTPLTKNFTLEEKGYYLINPGTAGEPRNQLPLSFLVFDTNTFSIEYYPFELSESEEKELMRQNREVFGGFKMSRVPAQIKEKLKKIYYSLSI
ncbi:MAG: metallophosphoesterase [Calditrichaeota bacterium]|nr:MAG: metallophosphoesterase [Calditrichota bacterium]